jgi:galactitol-specific phosphotransferase system IIC component
MSAKIITPLAGIHELISTEKLRDEVIYCPLSWMVAFGKQELTAAEPALIPLSHISSFLLVSGHHLPLNPSI